MNFNFCRKKTISIEDYLELLFLYSKEISMIQVGANDGSLCDPIRKYVLLNKVKGIMLEPQADVFKNLQKNYFSVSGLNFVNKALSEHNGSTSLYSVSDFLIEQYPDLSGVASFFKPHLVKEIKSNKHKLNFKKGEGVEDYIIKTQVETINYSALLQKYSIDQLDLLMIDAEGFDFEAVMLFPFDEIKPKAVLFEDKHIKKLKKTSLNEYLCRLGYKPFHAKNDVLFILT